MPLSDTKISRVHCYIFWWQTLRDKGVKSARSCSCRSIAIIVCRIRCSLSQKVCFWVPVCYYV